MTTDYDEINSNFRDMCDDPKLAKAIRKDALFCIYKYIKDNNEKEKESYYSTIPKIVFFKFFFYIFKFLISLFAVIVYIMSTYNDYDRSKKMNKFIEISELVIANLVIVSLITSFLLTENKKRFFFKFFHILDVLIVISIYIYYFLKIKKFKIASILRIARMSKILSVYRLFQNPNKSRASSFFLDNRQIYLVKSLINIIAILLLSTTLIHFMACSFPHTFEFVDSQNGMVFNLTEFNKTETVYFPFDYAFYYTVITLTSAGYGDITPSSTGGKLLMSIIVIIFIIIFTVRNNQFNQVFRSKKSYLQIFKENNHVVIIGDISPKFLEKFISLFYLFPKNEKTKILIINENYPTKEIKKILFLSSPRIHYYTGCIFNDDTIINCNIELASFIFLISDPLVNNKPINEIILNPDQFLILVSKILTKGLASRRILCQFSSSNSLYHSWANWDYAFNSKEIQMAMMCKNGSVNGFITLILNLFTGPVHLSWDDSIENDWLGEYVNGALNSIGIIKVSKEYMLNRKSSRKFSLINEEEPLCVEYNDIIKELALFNETIVLGVKRKIGKIINNRRISTQHILINPFGEKIFQEDELIVISRDINKIKNLFNNPGQKMLINLSNLIEPNQLIQDSIIFNKSSSLLSSKRYFKLWESHYSELEVFLTNHVMLICPEDDIVQFMNIYSKMYDDYLFYVSEYHPSSNWDILQNNFPKLIYIECSFSDVNDFCKLRVELAKHVYILSLKDEFSLSDSRILPIIKIIQENFPKTKLTIELEDEDNIKHINNFNDKGTEKISYKLWRRYASSEVFLRKFLAYLPVIFHQSPYLLEILLKILGIHNKHEVFEFVDEYDYIENNEIVCFEYRNSTFISYEEILKYFLSKDDIIMPIAVYRKNKCLHSKENDGYIVTNPKLEMKIFQNDKILCFGKELKQLNEVDELGFKYVNSSLKNEIKFSESLKSYDNFPELLQNTEESNFKEANSKIMKILEEEINNLEEITECEAFESLMKKRADSQKLLMLTQRSKYRKNIVSLDEEIINKILEEDRETYFIRAKTFKFPDQITTPPKKSIKKSNSKSKKLLNRSSYSDDELESESSRAFKTKNTNKLRKTSSSYISPKGFSELI